LTHKRILPMDDIHRPILAAFRKAHDAHDVSLLFNTWCTTRIKWYIICFTGRSQWLLSENVLSTLLRHTILVLRLMNDKDRMMQ